MFFPDMSGKRLPILGLEIAIQKRTSQPLVLTFAVHLVYVLVENVLVRESFLTAVTAELFGHVVFHVIEKLFGAR